MRTRNLRSGFFVKILVSALAFRFTKSSADGFITPPRAFSVAAHHDIALHQHSPLPYQTRLPKLLPITVRGGQLQSSLVDSLWKQHPFVAAALVCAIKAFAADVVAQRRQLSAQSATNTSMDRKRTLAFVLYGALYQGMVQEFIYNHLYSRLFGDSPTLSVIATKVAFDAIFHNALVCVPMAYIVKACVFRYSLREGLRRYLDDVLHHGLLLKYYSIWIPVNFCVYAFIPKHWRITTMAVVSFFWMTILSTIASRKR